MQLQIHEYQHKSSFQKYILDDIWHSAAMFRREHGQHKFYLMVY